MSRVVKREGPRSCFSGLGPQRCLNAKTGQRGGGRGSLTHVAAGRPPRRPERAGAARAPSFRRGPAGRAGGGPPLAGPGLTLWRRFAPQVFLQVRPPGSAHEEAPVREQTADPAAKTASRPPAGRGRGCVQRSCPFAPHPAASRTSPGKAFRGRKRHVRAAEQPWCVVFGWPWTRHGRLPCVVPTPLP